jgi:DNA helicase-2/ATP-dependent DNA helicase PcrA
VGLGAQHCDPSRLAWPTSLPRRDIPTEGFEFFTERLTDHQVSLLTYSETDDATEVQLMDLYQLKGRREADATIVVLRGNDYFGKEGEPVPVGSKLLYVVLTRADGSR